MTIKRIIYRLIFLGLTILIIPFLPIAIIFLGISEPQYVIYGTLNISLTQKTSLSYWEVYTNFLSRIILFDFGSSTASGQLVVKEISSALKESLKAIAPAIIISYLIGSWFGILALKSELFEKIWQKTEFIFYIPMIVFSYLSLYTLDRLRIDFLSNIKYFCMAIILSIYPTYIVSKSIKKTIQDIAKSEFFVFHQSYGFSDKQIWLKFCKRFIFIDYLSFFENLIIFMLGFIFFVETPFAVHGIGYQFVFAIQRFDYPIIIGFSIITIILLSVIGIIVETVKLGFDPRDMNNTKI